MSAEVPSSYKWIDISAIWKKIVGNQTIMPKEETKEANQETKSNFSPPKNEKQKQDFIQFEDKKVNVEQNENNNSMIKEIEDRIAEEDKKKKLLLNQNNYTENNENVGDNKTLLKLRLGLLAAVGLMVQLKR